MKKFFNKIAIVIIAGCCVIASCGKKDSTTTPTTTAPANTSSATVSGTSYSATNQIILPTDSASALSNYSQGNYPSLPSGGGYVSLMGSYPIGTDTVAGHVLTGSVYSYIFGQAVVSSSNDTLTWGFTIASLGSEIKAGTYAFTPLTSDTTTDTNLITALISGTSPTLAAGYYGDSKQLFNDSVSTGSVTITSISTADSTIVGSYTLDVIGTKGSVPPTITISNAQFNIHYENLKTTK